VKECKQTNVCNPNFSTGIGAVSKLRLDFKGNFTIQKLILNQFIQSSTE
jgi:hypothetical protein